MVRTRLAMRAAGTGRSCRPTGGRTSWNLPSGPLAGRPTSGCARRFLRAPALAGDSADAAAVLRWAGCTDAAVAVGLGADVPFCLAGGRAVVGGIGEIVEPLSYKKTDVLLVIPHLAVSTPAVYTAWDALGGPSGDHENDLEPAALAVEPRLAWWRRLVEDTAGRRPRLAGSGGTWWLEGGRDELAEHSRRLSAAVIAAGESAVVQLTSTVPSLNG